MGKVEAYMQILFCSAPAHDPPRVPRAANITCTNIHDPRHLVPSFTHHHRHVLNSSHRSGYAAAAADTAEDPKPTYVPPNSSSLAVTGPMY